MTQYKVIEANQRKMLSVIGFLNGCAFKDLTSEEFEYVFEQLKEKFPLLQSIKDNGYRNARVTLNTILEIKQEIEKSKDEKLKNINEKIIFNNHFIKKVDKEEVFKDKIRTPFLLRPNESTILIRNYVFDAITEKYYYAQSDFNGPVYPGTLNSISEVFLRLKSQQTAQFPYDQTLSFGYIDDDDIPCGICIHKSDYEQPRYFFVHTRNSNSSNLEDRKQTIIYDENFFQKAEINEPNLDAPAMLKDGRFADDSANKVESSEKDKRGAFQFLLSILNSDNARKFLGSIFTEDGTLLPESIPKYQRILSNMMANDELEENSFLKFYNIFIEKYRIKEAKLLEFEDYYDDNFVLLLNNLIKNKIPNHHQKQALYDILIFVENRLDKDNIEKSALNALHEICLQHYIDDLNGLNASCISDSEKLRISNKQAYIKEAKEKFIPELVEISELNALIAKAKDKALKDIEILNFDPQGRVLIELDSHIVSLDVGFEENLKNKFLEDLQTRLYGSLPQNQTKDSKNIISALDKLPSKNSIIFLQHEMYFHLSLVLKVYKKQFPQLTEHNISSETLQKVNDLVMHEFVQALINSCDGSSELRLDVLNEYLDSKRIDIAEKAHDYLLEELDTEKYKLNLNAFDFEKAQTDAAHTTATNKPILHVDRHLNTLTEIEGSIFTSHRRERGDIFAHRAVKTYRMSEDLQVQYKLSGRQIRTPSLPVKTGLSEQEYIDDTVTKIKRLVWNYSIAKPFTYNLLTAMQHRPDDLFTTNKQTQSARHIMLGAHDYNKMVLTNGDENYCLIQAISVNGFGRALGYRDFGIYVRVPNEATLLAEMALCYNMGESNILDKYKAFLNPPKENSIWDKIKSFFRSPYFVSSKQGQDLRQEIAAKKRTRNGRQEVAPADNAALVRTSLQKIMAYDLHFSHEYAKLIQALSIFLEDESILGCKSGNERTPIIMEREQLLEQVKIPEDLQQAFLYVAHAENKKETQNALKNLKSMVNKHYNEENLYGASALIPLADQGAGHKISAKNGYGLDSNKAEDQKSEGITNLHQKNTRALQAHNDLPNFMNDAINRRRKKYLSESEKIAAEAKSCDAPIYSRTLKNNSVMPLQKDVDNECGNPRFFKQRANKQKTETSESPSDSLNKGP